MDIEKASAKRMKVGGERKHLKSILYNHNVTCGRDWFASRNAWQEALASAPGVVHLFRLSIYCGDMVPKTIPIQKILS